MPHPTTPSTDKEATGPSYPVEGQNVQTTRAEFKVAERPFIRPPLSSAVKLPFSPSKTEVRFPVDVIPTPPLSPARSSLGKPLSHQADSGILSPPVTPESQRYSKAPVTASRYRKVGGDSWKGFAERMTDEVSVGGRNGLDDGAADTEDEKELPIDKSQSPVESAQTGLAPPGTMPESPRSYEGTFELRVGAEGHYEEYGRGAWSIVYSAEHTPNNRIYGVGGGTKMIVAVKAPIWQGSVSILKNEALILTCLQPREPLSPTQGQGEGFRHIVSFLGYHSPTQSLVLESVPLTLAAYSKAKAIEVKKNFSHKTMRDPVVGMEVWLHIVRDLVVGLEFLYKKGVVHGDIKPMNILMRPPTTGGGGISNENVLLERENGPFQQDLYTPIFCDFSSSRLIHPSIPPTEPSALTDRFAAPELLDHRKPGITTFASDTYSLAVTLLSPALGTDVYAAAANQMQALHWAKEGRPLDFARNTEAGLRVARGGLVDKVVGGAARKEKEERWGVGEWVEIMRKVLREEGAAATAEVK